MSEPRLKLRLLTKPGCHLCDDMKANLTRASRGIVSEMEEVDISADPSLSELYGNDIPVLFVNGRKAFKHRASEEELRKRLLRERPEGGKTK